MHESIKFFQKVTDPSTDFLDTIDEHKFQLNRLTDFKPILKGVYFPEVMKRAKKATTKAFLVGSLIKVGDIAILFSGPENGKSILGIQMADKISKGESLFNGLLRNECEPQKVVYFDFELSLGDYKNRYLDEAGNEYPFRDDGWMGACLNLDSALEVSELKKLRLRYALWVHDGVVTQPQIEGVWNTFAALPIADLRPPKK